MEGWLAVERLGGGVPPTGLGAAVVRIGSLGSTIEFAAVNTRCCEPNTDNHHDSPPSTKSQVVISCLGLHWANDLPVRLGGCMWGGGTGWGV